MRVAAETLKTVVADCAERLGLSGPDAALLADTLVQANLWGHPSHGVMRLFWYAARFKSGAIRLDAPIERIADAGALAVLEGHDGIGQRIAADAMDLAIEKAGAHGVGAVAVRNSGHFGTAMYFTRRAAKAGCIGFLSTNSSPAMPPFGGKEKRIGATPWSLAAPAGRYPTLMLDISNTSVARGKLHDAKARGREIPPGWAIDADGAPTTDPAAGILGAILPMAGHKGYGVAVMMDVLSGILAGGGFGGQVVGPFAPEGASRAGHFAFAIDIAACRPSPSSPVRSHAWRRLGPTQLAVELH
ncbi:MAG: Ldh family oxidoreductase, partial [Pseudomonadota bacterium]